MYQAHKYRHIVDESGAHWLVGPDRKSYFNGVAWVSKAYPLLAMEDHGDVTIEDFLIVLGAALNHEETTQMRISLKTTKD